MHFELVTYLKKGVILGVCYNVLIGTYFTPYIFPSTSMMGLKDKKTKHILCLKRDHFFFNQRKKD